MLLRVKALILEVNKVEMMQATLEFKTLFNQTIMYFLVYV